MSSSATRAGLFYALGSFCVWGLSPLYFKTIAHLPALEIVAHRVVWSLLFVLLLVALGQKWRELVEALRPVRQRWLFALTTALISGNWLLFVFAVNSGKVLQISLGYFISPLLTVLLGTLFLKEKLNRLQQLSVMVAGVGVLNLLLGFGAVPWLSLLLASSFAVYGLLRKQVRVDSLVGLLVETALVAPLAVAFLSVNGWVPGEPARTSWQTLGLLSLSGIFTALPLLWYVHAARRLRLATVGLLQYLSPSLQFLLAVLAFHERFTRAHAITFGCLWLSIALYSHQALRKTRAATQPA